MSNNEENQPPFSGERFPSIQSPVDSRQEETVGETVAPIDCRQHRIYSLGKKIGSGTYSTVYLARRCDLDPEKRFACKVILKRNFSEQYLKHFLPRELHIIKRLDHPNIVRVSGIIENQEKVGIIMDYCENADLLFYIEHNGCIDENQAKTWFRQIVSAIEYLHSLNIAHRDLKCENMLFTAEWQIKVADFGFSRYIVDSNNNNVLSNTFCGSAAYAAPNILVGMSYDPREADIWSLGVILFIMVNGAMPFDDSDLRALVNDQLSRSWSFKKNVTFTPSVRELVSLLLEPQAERRIKLGEIYTSKWLNN